MGILSKIGISKGKKAKSVKMFENLFPGKSFLEVDYKCPSDYVNICWSKFKEQGVKNINGQMLEIIIATLFIRENLFPIYIQATVAFVPNVSYDMLLYNKEFGPISLSMKTSLRERYKQADLEAIALKYVHRKAKCYLLTLEENEAKNTKGKIVNGEAIGLDDVVLCSSDDIDILVSSLKKMQFTIAGSVDIIKSTKIVTHENILNI